MAKSKKQTKADQADSENDASETKIHEQEESTHKSKRKSDLNVSFHVDEEDGLDESVDESHEEENANKVRRVVKKLNKMLKPQEGELPADFAFPCKKDISALDADSKERFLDEATSLGEKTVNLSIRILDSWGHKPQGRANFLKQRLAMKAFEPAELWRHVSNFSKHCCSKAVRSMRDFEEGFQETRDARDHAQNEIQEEDTPETATQNHAADSEGGKEKMQRDADFMTFYMSQFTDAFADELDELRKQESLGGEEVSRLIDSIQAGTDVISDLERQLLLPHSAAAGGAASAAARRKSGKAGGGGR